MNGLLTAFEGHLVSDTELKFTDKARPRPRVEAEVVFYAIERSDGG